MGWNEPPENKNGKDPWGNRGNDDGPPDLDEVLKKMQNGLGGIFGKKKAGGPGDGDSDQAPIPWAIIIIAIFAWLLYDSFHIIDEQEKGVVMRFGKYVSTLPAGPNFTFPRPIDSVTKVNVGQVRPLTHRASMLTQDENIVDVEVAIKWRINDPAYFLFNVVDQVSTLRQATESSIREVVGKSKLDFVLTEGRGEISQRQHVLMQQILDDYETGIFIEGVELQSANPPEQVKEAFDDAIKAREDEQRLVNEAEAYRNEIIPRARGEAARFREEANAYKARVIAKSEGEANRFEQQLKEYQRAPEITRERLYLDTMENVLSNTNKVLMDVDDGNSLMYLPIDQLMKQSTSSDNQTLSVPRDYIRNQLSQGTREIENRLNERSRGIR